MEYNHTSSRPNIHKINNSKIYETFVYVLKELKEKICNCKSNISTYKTKKDIEKIIYELKESFEKLDELLYTLVNYKKEYLNFLQIKRMTFYILEDYNLFKHMNSIEKLFNSYYKVISSKNKLNEREYEKINKRFNKELLNFEQFFYTKVCKESENYNEETLSSIINSLV